MFRRSFLALLLLLVTGCTPQLPPKRLPPAPVIAPVAPLVPVVPIVKPSPDADAAAAPTPGREVERVIGLLPKPEIGFADLGCGDGRWLFAAARKWPGCKITGIEIDSVRADTTRELVRLAGLDNVITIITGDALTADFRADVVTLYLYPDTITKLLPRLEKMKAVASYIHKLPMANVKQSGDTFIYSAPVTPITHPTAVWNGQVYYGPVCSAPNCAMCASIRAQMAVAQPQPQSKTGEWVRMCDRNRNCWYQWVEK